MSGVLPPVGPGPQQVGLPPQPVPAAGQEIPPPPPELVMPIAQATGLGPGMVAAFLMHLARTMPQVLERVLRRPPAELRQLILEFADSPAGQNPPPPPQPMPGPLPLPPEGGLVPPADGALPSSGAPLGGVGVPQAGEGPSPLPDPGASRPAGQLPMMPNGAPGAAQVAPGPTPKPKPKLPGPKRVKRPKAPSWEPPELPKPRYPKGPDRATVLRHDEEGGRYFSALTKALEQWRRIYHGVEEDETLAGLPNNPWKGERPVTRAQPTLMAQRVIGLTAPTLERLGLQVRPWADDDESQDAAQEVENFARSALEELYRRSARTATRGLFQPAMPRHMAGLAVVEGGAAARIMPNPDAVGLPWDVDLVPLYELRPRPIATTRHTECSLGEAWAYPEMLELFPREELDAASPLYDEETRVTLITWTDETHWCMTCEGADPGLAKKVAGKYGERDWWVQKPVEHKLGRRIYVVPNPWDATPLGPSPAEQDRAKHLSRGIYAPLAPQIALVNQIAGALRAGAFKQLKPALKWKLNPTLRSQYPDVFPKITQDTYDKATMAGGHVVLGPDEDVNPIDQSFAGSADGQALLSQASADMGDAAPPVLGGRGAAQSGFDRFQANEAAGVLHVDPIIQWCVEFLELILETLLTDFARLGKRGDGQLFTKLPYRVYKQRGKLRGGGFVQQLTAKDVMRAGPYVKVTFKRLGLTERLQLAQLHQLLIREHLESRLSAMDELGVDDTEREQARMLLEVALEHPSVVKAAMRTALQREAASEPQDGEDADLHWARIFLDAVEEELLREQTQGAPPQPPGLPSPVGLPGGGGLPPMPGGAAPAGPMPMPGM